MNWISSLFTTIILLFTPTGIVSPASPKADVLQNFQKILESSSVTYSNLKYYDYRHEIEFDIDTTHAILNSTKNPLIQVSALQKIIKEANIKSEQVILVDLGQSNPYATFKNN